MIYKARFLLVGFMLGVLTFVVMVGYRHMTEGRTLILPCTAQPTAYR